MRSLDLVPSMLAIWRVGALYVPMDVGFPKNRLAYMVSNANVQVVITNWDALPLIEDSGIQSLCVEDIDVGFDVEQILPACASNSAMILFTSGSTGKPKGVEIRHSALLNCLLAAKDLLEFTAQSRMLAITTISFDISTNELLMPLLAGGCVDIGEDGLAGDGIRMSELIESRNPSHVQATVSTWKAVLAAGWKGNPEICLISAGEALSRETAEQLLAKSRCMWNLYGPTETTVYSSAYPVKSAPGKPMQIGRPLPNTQMYILNQAYQPVPIGAIGDRYIGGEGLAVGYWQKPELTNERFVTNPFRPGEKNVLNGRPGPLFTRRQYYLPGAHR
jgi:non-ribosomal peptide synthetase component F